MDYKLRFISYSDIEIILPLFYEKYPELSSQYLRHSLGECLKTDYKILAIMSENISVAMIGISYGIKIYCGEFLELHHLFVSEKYRLYGIGSKLLKYVESYSKMRDIGLITLDSYLEAIDVHKIYQKNNFNILGYHFTKEI